MNNIFRKSSLDKLSSVDQLDKMIGVSKVSSWFCLSGVAIIMIAALMFLFTGKIYSEIKMDGIYIGDGKINNIYSYSQDYVKSIYYDVGDRISKGDIIGYIGKEKIISDYNGIVNELYIDYGQLIQKGDLLAEIREVNDKDKIVIAYIGLQDGRKLQEGMKVNVVPNIVNEAQTGHMTGTIHKIGLYGISSDEMYRRLGDWNLVNYFMSHHNSGSLLEIIIKLDTSNNTKSGFQWSTNAGEKIELMDNLLTNIRIIIQEKTPAESIFN